MPFEPMTTLYFLRTGIDENNKIRCKTQAELFQTLTSGECLRGRSQDCSFQRGGGLHPNALTMRVASTAIDYYNLLMCDTVMYLNNGNNQQFYIVGNILTVEWKNPDCTFVTFKIDSFMTYQTMIDWDKTYAYVEREHVKDDWAADGHPQFTNIGMYEDFHVEADTPIYHYEKSFKPNLVLIHSPYDSNGEAVFEGEFLNGVYSSLQTDVVGANGANEFFTKVAESKEASINNIVGVYSVPQDFADIIRHGGVETFVESLPPVDTANMTKFPLTYNNAKCWAAPYCLVKLISSEGGELTFNPQWFGTDQNSYRFLCKYVGTGNMFGGAMATFDNQAGAFAWESWNDWAVMLTKLPESPWTADGFSDWKSTRNTALIARQVSAMTHGLTGMLNSAANGFAKMNDAKVDQGLNAVSTITGILNSGATAAMTMANIESTISSAQASGAVVSGNGSFDNLFDVGQEAWGFKVVYLIVQNYIMRGIDNFFDRFGYRVNKLKKLELENRPIWTFVKTAECHVAAGSGLTYVAELEINAMFNRGVTIWKADKFSAGRQIGDFSNPQENRGLGE